MCNNTLNVQKFTFYFAVGVTTRENVDHTEDCDNVIKYFCSWCQRVKLSSENLLNDTEVWINNIK